MQAHRGGDVVAEQLGQGVGGDFLVAHVGGDAFGEHEVADVVQQRGDDHGFRLSGLLGQLRALQRVLGLADGLAAVVGGAVVGEQIFDGGQGEHGMPSWTGIDSDDIASG